ncbi:hypothetical protein SAMD00023353_5300190 [Rosellinia necatrix]|uniref:Uncharacterized protein n=1 Tax=Rosellinia necatrix TaxID=77044 RepID=A0A1W2TRW7_ROSNE|nr:hypothetical protein SAMD00023353_5300190 [Rosellinia necatrix]
MDRQVDDSAGWAMTTHNLGFAMQEYLLLYGQHEELCQRLHELRPSLPASTSSLSPSSCSSTSSISFSLASTVVASPSISPHSPWTKEAPPPSKLSVSPSRDQRRIGMPGTACHLRASQSDIAYDETLVGEVAAGERKLFDVNEGLKRALTELLNCEAVRQDRAMRTWVQTRLLETEKELRRGRRRRSSAAAAD